MTVIKAAGAARLGRGGGVETVPLITRKTAAEENKITTGISTYPPGTGAPLHSHNCDEQVAWRFSTEILRDHFVSDETFAAALGEFGEAGLVDLIGSLGNYSMLAMLLNAFQVDLQPVEPPYPDVRGYAKVDTA